MDIIPICLLWRGSEILIPQRRRRSLYYSSLIIMCGKILPLTYILRYSSYGNIQYAVGLMFQIALISACASSLILLCGFFLFFSADSNFDAIVYLPL
jgi:hypothetical protein